MQTKDQVTVLHVVGDSAFGGASRIILRLAQLAKAEGCQVDILTTDPVFREAAQREGIGVVSIDVIRRPIRPLWDMLGLIRLCRFLRVRSYTMVHTHTSKAGFVGRLAAWLAGVPIVVHTAHGFAFHERTPASSRAAYSILERVASYGCDRIAFVSEFHREWALKLGMCGPDKAIAIPNGIVARRRKPQVHTVELRRSLGVRDDDVVILSMGRLAAEKGLEHLMEAASILRYAEPRFRIWIAGEGPQGRQLEDLAAALEVTDRVTFLGHREDIGDLLAACDLVVLPSLREGLSIALLEAMAAGKAIVTTRIGSNLEVANQAEMAILVETGDPRALYQAMLHGVRDSALRARLGSNARMLFEKRYTEDRMLNSYRRLYGELIESKCSASVGVSKTRQARIARIS